MHSPISSVYKYQKLQGKAGQKNLYCQIIVLCISLQREGLRVRFYQRRSAICIGGYVMTEIAAVEINENLAY